MSTPQPTYPAPVPVDPPSAGALTPTIQANPLLLALGQVRQDGQVPTSNNGASDGASLSALPATPTNLPAIYTAGACPAPLPGQLDIEMTTTNSSSVVNAGHLSPNAQVQSPSTPLNANPGEETTPADNLGDPSSTPASKRCRVTIGDPIFGLVSGAKRGNKQWDIPRAAALRPSMLDSNDSVKRFNREVALIVSRVNISYLAYYVDRTQRPVGQTNKPSASQFASGCL
ncbi:hypothetical protein BD779DRAFT_1682496 [Infundibulicybe gibba]|nr:hypothetical protein BD779DRAFT_1682496 [Infundibulicybe gibba]